MGVTSPTRIREEEAGSDECVGRGLLSWDAMRRKEQVAARLQGKALSMGRAAVDQREAGRAAPAKGRCRW